MTAYNVISPLLMVNGQPEDISVPEANFAAISQVINGGIDDTNIAANAQIQLSKLQGYGTFGGVSFTMPGNMTGPGYIHMMGDIYARQNSNPVGIGNMGPSSEPGITIQDVTIYRSAAGVLQTTATAFHIPNLQERSEKGAAGGYAPLDGSAHVPVVNIPDLSGTYQILSAKGQVSGYASLDGGGKVPLTQLPTLDQAHLPDLSATYQVTSAKAQANGYPSLDASTHVPLAQIPTMDLAHIPPLDVGHIPDLSATYQVISAKGQANGYASLDGTTKVPLAQLPMMDASHLPDLSGTYQVVSARGAANGYATLDAGTKVPVAQIPNLAGTYQVVTALGVANGYASLDSTGKVPPAQLPASIAGIPAGGTAGQVLTKNTGTNYDTGWATPAGGGGGALLADSVIPSGTRLIANKFVAGDANNAWRLDGNGLIQWGAGGASALDTNLYRGAALWLYTDNNLAVGVGMYVGNGSQSTDAAHGIKFGSAGDTNLYRSAAGVLKTDGNLQAAGTYVAGNVIGAGEVLIGAVGPSSQSAVLFHSDTNLYRSAAGDLKTDGRFLGVGDVIARLGAVQQVIMGDNNAGAAGLRFGSAGDTSISRIAAGAFGLAGGVYVQSAPLGVGYSFNPGTFTASNLAFQSSVSGESNRWQVTHGGQMSWGPGGATAVDTNLYRAAAGDLRTDGVFRSGLSLVVNERDSAGEKLYFGSAVDTNLYRVSANLLKTDGTFRVGQYVMGGFDGVLGNFAFVAMTSSDSTPRWTAYNDGSLHWGPGTAATDTALYRESAGRMKLDGGANYGEIWAQGTVPRFGLYAPGGTADKRKVVTYLDQGAQMWNFVWMNDAEGTSKIVMRLGYDGTLYADNAMVCGIAQATGTLYFANAWNCYLAGRASDGVIQTSGAFYAATMLQAATSVYARLNAATQVFLGDVSDLVGGQPTGTRPSVVFGNAADTYLYRSYAAGLKTNGALLGDNDLIARDADATYRCTMGYTSNGPGLVLGTANDTRLHRISAGVVGVNGVQIGGTKASNAVAPADPPTTISTSFIHAGIGLTITPGNGTFLIWGNWNFSSGPSEGRLVYGTGAAPAQGASGVGTVIGKTSGGAGSGGKVVGSAGTTYWVDFQYRSVDTGVHGPTAITVMAWEV